MFSTNHDPRSINSLLLCAQVALLNGSVSNIDIINVLDVAQDLISLTVTISADNEISATNSNKEQPTPRYAPYTGSINIGQRIRLARKYSDLKQSHIANALGVTIQAVSLWENDSTVPTCDKIIPLANVLKCDPMWLLSGAPLEVTEESL